MIGVLSLMFEVSKEFWVTHRDKTRFATQCELVWIPVASRLLEDRVMAEDESGNRVGQRSAERWRQLTAIVNQGLSEVSKGRGEKISEENMRILKTS